MRPFGFAVQVRGLWLVPLVSQKPWTSIYKNSRVEEYSTTEGYRRGECHKMKVTAGQKDTCTRMSVIEIKCRLNPAYLAQR